jgi:hypothetical protein
MLAVLAAHVTHATQFGHAAHAVQAAHATRGRGVFVASGTPRRKDARAQACARSDGPRASWRAKARRTLSLLTCRSLPPHQLAQHSRRTSSRLHPSRAASVGCPRLGCDPASLPTLFGPAALPRGPAGAWQAARPSFTSGGSQARQRAASASQARRAGQRRERRAGHKSAPARRPIASRTRRLVADLSAAAGNAQRTAALLGDERQVNEADAHGLTALQWAASDGLAEVCGSCSRARTSR